MCEVSSEPIYRQIVNNVLDRIDTAELSYGAKLPTEREMAVNFGASRGTVKKAYAELEKDGVISIVWGSGAYVIKKNTEHKRPEHELGEAFFQALVESGLTPKEAEEYASIRYSKAFRPGQVNIALIDNCPECLSVFARQLKEFRGLKVSSFLPEDLSRFKNRHLLFDEFDLLLAGENTSPALQSLLSHSKTKILPFNAAPNKDTQIDLIKIMNFEKSGLFSDSRAFRDIVNAYFEPKGRRYGEKDQLLAKWTDKDGFDNFVADKRYLIMPPLYSMEIMTTVYDGLFDFLRRGGDIIVFNYEIERTSLLHVEERVQKILYST